MILSDENFLNFAMKHYDNIHCKTVEEFNEDLNKVLYIKKLLNRILLGELINFRLVLNHLIIFYNVFESDAATAILFFKIESDKWLILNTFLTYLSYSPKFIKELNLDLNKIGIEDQIMLTLKSI